MFFILVIMTWSVFSYSGHYLIIIESILLSDMAGDGQYRRVDIYRIFQRSFPPSPLKAILAPSTSCLMEDKFCHFERGSFYL